MLNLNELFNIKPGGEDSVYKLEEPAITPSYQTYRITAQDGTEYQVKFDNRPWLGKNVQMIRIGQINPDQKKFKPLIQKIKHPLDFLGALKYVLMQHTFVNKYTSKKNGFVLLVQQDKLSVPMALVVKIAMKILLPEFKIVSADGTPTAEQMGNPGLKDGEFDVIVFRRATMSTDNVFNEPAGQVMVHGEFKPAGDKVTPATTPAPEPVKSMSAGTTVVITPNVDAIESNKSAPKAKKIAAVKPMASPSEKSDVPSMPDIKGLSSAYLKTVYDLATKKEPAAIKSFLQKLNIPKSQALLKWLIKIDSLDYKIPDIGSLESAAKLTGKPIGLALKGAASPPPVSPVAVQDRYFWLPTRSDWPFSNADANIGKLRDGKLYLSFDGKIMSMTLSPTDLYWFKDINEATKARAWLLAQPWQLPAQSAGRARVDKKEPLPPNTTANEDVALSLRFFPMMGGADGTAEWFVKNIEKLMVMKIIKNNSYVSSIKLSQIYKWNDGDTGEYFVNTFNTVGIVGKVAPPDDKEFLSAEKAQQLKKAKKGYANGLRALTLSPETIQWLAANPPAEAGDKEVIEWKDYKSAFHILDNETIEVNGFDLKFSSNTPEKLFKQLNNFETMVGASSAEMTALQAKLKDTFNKMSSAQMKFLSDLQVNNFPSSYHLKQYTGSDYGWINKTLRGSSSDEDTKGSIKAIDDYFKINAKRLPKKVVVYRGQSVLIKEIEGLLGGNEYVMHSFVSTSTNLQTANSFMNDGEIKPQWFLSSAEGSHVVKKVDDLPYDKERKIKCLLVITGLDRCLSVAPGNWGLHHKECEVIINRGTKLKIDPTIPIRLFATYGGNAKSDPAYALIYCTISGDGAIDYEVNEMTTEDTAGQPARRTTFDEALDKMKVKDGVEKTVVLDNFVKDKSVKPEQYPGSERWNDDIFE